MAEDTTETVPNQPDALDSTLADITKTPEEEIRHLQEVQTQIRTILEDPHWPSALDKLGLRGIEALRTLADPKDSLSQIRLCLEADGFVLLTTFSELGPYKLGKVHKGEQGWMTEDGRKTWGTVDATAESLIADDGTTFFREYEQPQVLLAGSNKMARDLLLKIDPQAIRPGLAESLRAPQNVITLPKR